MFAMHGDKNTYLTVNIFGDDRHPFFFISDPPTAFITKQGIFG